MTWTQNETTLGTNATLAWAATTAVAVNLASVAQSGLLLMFQQRYNAANALYRSLGYPVGRIAEDGAWGGQSALALIVALAAGRAANETNDVLIASGLVSAFDFAHNGAAINSKTKLADRYAAMRDATTAYANRTQGVLRAFTTKSAGLLDVVRNAPTTADVAGRAQPYLGTLYADGATASMSTAATVSTRMMPNPEILNQALQTPSVEPNIIPTSTQQAANITPAEMVFPAENVTARPWKSTANLKVIIPSVIVGSLLLVWAVKQKQKRGRK